MKQEATSSNRSERYFYGTGRRKSAIARVRLYPGNGAITVNDKPFMEAIPWLTHQITVRLPLQIAEASDKFDVVAKVEGGGVSAWAGAINLGVTRALIEYDSTLKPALRKAGLVTRDPRVKERKKPGLKRARKAPQYTKR